jgi:hypothetical protein
LNAVPDGSFVTVQPSANPLALVSAEVIKTPSGEPTEDAVTLAQTVTAWPGAGFMGLPPMEIAVAPTVLCLLVPAQPMVRFVFATPPEFARMGPATITAMMIITNDMTMNLEIFI